jgi:hypothetical protein
VCSWPSRIPAQEPVKWDPQQPFKLLGRDLKIQPILMYRLPVSKEAASWKSWGGIQTEPAVAEEVQRIGQELNRLVQGNELGLQILPLARVTTVEEAQRLANQDYDVTLLYACTGGSDLLQACLRLKKDNVIFVRHRSGPVYYWYEALSTRLLATDARPPDANATVPSTNAHVEDVVVDDYAELAWRFRALRGVRNFLGSRVVALGGPWGKYAPDAPQKAQERFGLKIIEVSYDDFGPRIRQALEDTQIIAAAEAAVDRYLSLPQTTLKTDRKFVVNAFVLHRLFTQLLEEHDAAVFTIKSCMGTILPMAKTTACLTLGLLNDEGLIAFCESDFVIIPAGLLFRHIAGKPVFLHNSTFPHQGLVTCAHCTSPRRLDGKRYEPAQLVTHYESDYGAAPKVEMPLGQELTFVDPQYSSTRWVGFKGLVKANPFYDICRSQQDVEIQGAWQKLKSEARDSHWVMAYGDYLKELRYAARKVGVEWVSLTDV